MKYENRVVAFWDILGFREVIRGTYDGAIDNEEAIDRLHATIRAADEHIGKDPNCQSLQFTQFSDSFVVSFLVEEKDQVFYTLSSIQMMIAAFVMNGYLLRGGLSYGKLTHTKDVLFGPAMIAAYEAESEAAIFPRVILDKSVIDLRVTHRSPLRSQSSVQDSLNNVVTQDTDDMWYVDYFSKVQSEFDYPEYDFPIYLEQLRKLISKGIKIPKYGVRSKYG